MLTAGSLTAVIATLYKFGMKLLPTLRGASASPVTTSTFTRQTVGVVLGLLGAGIALLVLVFWTAVAYALYIGAA